MILLYVLAIWVVAGTGVALMVTRTGVVIGVLLLLLSLLIVDALVKRLNRFNARIRLFLDTVEDREHTMWFHEQSADPEMNALSHSFNRIHTLLAHARTHDSRQERFYQSLLEEMPHGIVAWNEQHRILFANTSALRLLEVESLCFFRQLTQLYPELAPFGTPGKAQGSFLLSALPQKQLTLSFNTLKLGTETLTLLAVKDIRQELNEKENESWHKLTRVLTHEIMNTLAPIISLSQSLSLHPDSDPKTQRKLHIICQQSERLRDFTASFRRLYSLPAPKRQPFSLTASLQNLCLLLQPDLERSHIRFRLHSTPASISVTGDEKQLEQVFLNLIRNSMQALEGQADGHIALHIAQADKLYIRLIDNGTGIPADVQEKIFVPFFTTKADGTGIGLSLCRQIVKQHQGDLYLQCSTPGHTQFVIELPLTPPASR